MLDAERAAGKGQLVGCVAPCREACREFADGLAVGRGKGRGNTVTVSRAARGDEVGAERDDAAERVDAFAEARVGCPCAGVGGEGQRGVEQVFAKETAVSCARRAAVCIADGGVGEERAQLLACKRIGFRE